MRLLRLLALTGLFLASAPLLPLGAETLPPAPQAYCNDTAHVLSPETVARLDARLADFERATSNQILVAIYPKMESESSVEDYTVRIANAWGVGQKGRENGAVLFVFVAEHKLYIQVGYGLEGALPDVTAKRIVSDTIAPYLKQGDFDGGIAAGVAAIMAATQGEYQGTGTTTDTGRGGAHNVLSGIIFLIFIGIIVLGRLFGGGGSSFYSPGGYYRGGGGGGFSGGGGGGFSGGGGSFGGGGAGGSW